MKSEEITYQKAYVSPRPPPKISCQDNWMKDLDSEVAAGSEDSQQNPTTIKKPNYQVWGDPYVGKSPQRTSRKISCLITRTSSTQQERGHPYRWIKKRSTKLISEFQDCHMQFVQEAEHLRVQELVKKDRNPSSSSSTSRPTCSTLTSTIHSAKFEGDDPRIG